MMYIYIERERGRKREKEREREREREIIYMFIITNRPIWLTTISQELHLLSEKPRLASGSTLRAKLRRAELRRAALTELRRGVAAE